MGSLRGESQLELSTQALIGEFLRVRNMTEQLALPLTAEDQCIQSMPDCSPTKWHRAHTTWFFETFVLGPRGISPVDARYGYLFNSYYEAVGKRHPRPKRGMLSRPSVAEIAAYRRAVDGRVVELLSSATDAQLHTLAPLISLGLAHEQQHQELLLTDALHTLSQNPLQPAYRNPQRLPARLQRMGTEGSRTPACELAFVPFPGGVERIGAAAGRGFRFDNEEPQHRVFIEPFAVANRLLTVGEWKQFANAGGYEEPRFWLSEGYAWVQVQECRSPMYTQWDKSGQTLQVFGLDGMRVAVDEEPIAHVSYYEADALARFFGARLPTEAEWEVAAALTGADPQQGNFLDTRALRPLPSVTAVAPTSTAGQIRSPGATGAGQVEADTSSPAALQQLFGDVWEWTQTPYSPYPGYEPGPGAIGEYNGKFMVNQQVLRGGSCLTPAGHVRRTYRNFWPAATGFQVSGVRLAKTLNGAAAGP